MFWCCFAYVFALLFAFSLPKLSRKNSLDVRFGVFGLPSFFLWSVSPTSSSFCLSPFFFRETAQVVTGHTPTRTCFAVSFSVFVSCRVCVCPFWPCVPLLGVFSGCHSGPRAFLGFSLDLLRPFSWDARRQGFSVLLLPCFSFSPFRCVLRLFFSHASRRGGPVIVRGIPPGHRTRPAPE